MAAEDRVERWRRAWAERRRRCLDEDLPRLPGHLGPDAMAIVEEARRLVGNEDPAVHAAFDVSDLVDRVNALPGDAPIILHRPVCNALTALRNNAQELLAAQAGVAEFAPLTTGRPARRRLGCASFLVVGEDPELSQLVSECLGDLPAPPPIAAARTLEAALDALPGPAAGPALVIANLSLDAAAGRGPHGLEVAREARRRHHRVLLVTAAADHHGYWSRLDEIGLTGHDVVVKTLPDFGGRLRARVHEIVRPAPVALTFVEDTGHVVRVGDVEVTDLEAQEAIVLHALDGGWRASDGIAARCWHSDLAPQPGNVPPLISALKTKLRRALLRAESDLAQCELIENQRIEGVGARYRLAPFLHWTDAPDPVGALADLPRVLVIDDEPDWASWVADCLQELGWPAGRVAVTATAAQARALLHGGDTPILIADLGLPDPATGLPDRREGVRLIEEVAAAHPGARVVVLSWHGRSDSLRARLFPAGVRTVDVIDKSAGRDERRAVLRAALQRAADEQHRGVRRVRAPAPVHRVERLASGVFEVDGRPLGRLSPREVAVLDVLMEHANEPVMADYLDDRCFPRRLAPDRNPLNRVHQTFKRLRQKIDLAAGRKGVGVAVIRTPHRGQRTTYELHGVVNDLSA